MDSFYSSKRSGDESGINGQYGLLLYVCSVVLHLAFVLGLMFYQNMSPQKRMLPPSIKVDLVSLDSPGLMETSQGKAAKSGPAKSAGKEKKVKSPKSEPAKPAAKKAAAKKAKVKLPEPEPVKPAVKEEKVKLPEPEPEPEPVKPVVKEEKVKLPEPEPVKPVVKEEKVKVPEPEPVKPVVVPEKIVPAKKEPEAKPGIKQALKKKTYSSEKVLEGARQAMEKKVAESTRESAESASESEESASESTDEKLAASAIESMEKRVAESAANGGSDGEENSLDEAFSRLEQKVTRQGGSRPFTNVEGTGIDGDKTDYEAIDLYNLELMHRIQQNWAFNERLAKSARGIETRVIIKILQNGQIRDIWFETRSGNSYLDDSAMKAVKKSAPLPPLPRGYTSYDIGLKFTPSGLK